MPGCSTQARPLDAADADRRDGWSASRGPVPVTMSHRILGLDWDTILPLVVSGLTVRAGSFERDAVPFVRASYEALFGGAAEAGRFLSDPETEAKRRFGAEMDTLCLCDGTRTVGLLIGHPLDWSTYYWRSVALLPEYRSRHALAQLMELTYEPLARVGIERVEGECSPTNAPMMRTLVKLGFVVTSTANSERWGATVRFTKFLREEAEEVFGRQFCRVRARGAPAPASTHPRQGRKAP